jgi:hypothetical protein
MFTQVIRTSILTGVSHTMILPISPDAFDAASERWQSGTMIQDAFPTLTAGEREFLMTGIHPDEWAERFGSDEDDL